VQRLTEGGQSDCRSDHERDPPPLVGNRVDALRVHRHQHEHRAVGRRPGDRRADHPEARYEHEVERDVEQGRDAGDDPVELRLPGAADADRDDDVAAQCRQRERRQRNDARALVELGSTGQQPHQPGREQPKDQGEP